MKRIDTVTEFSTPRIGKAADLARFAGALSHAVRVELLDLLKKRPRSSCTDLSQSLGLGYSIVGQHLKVMRGAGLIEGMAIGKQLIFFVNQQNLLLFQTIVANMSQGVDI